MALCNVSPVLHNENKANTHTHTTGMLLYSVASTQICHLQAIQYKNPLPKSQLQLIFKRREEEIILEVVKTGLNLFYYPVNGKFRILDFKTKLYKGELLSISSILTTKINIVHRPSCVCAP